MRSERFAPRDVDVSSWLLCTSSRAHKAGDVLAQRFVALCDAAGCKARTRAVVIFKLRPALMGLQHPIAMTPIRLVLPRGWRWGWVADRKATQIFCRRHRRHLDG